MLTWPLTSDHWLAVIWFRSTVRSLAARVGYWLTGQLSRRLRLASGLSLRSAAAAEMAVVSWSVVQRGNRFYSRDDRRPTVSVVLASRDSNCWRDMRCNALQRGDYTSLLLHCHKDKLHATVAVTIYVDLINYNHTDRIDIHGPGRDTSFSGHGRCSGSGYKIEVWFVHVSVANWNNRCCMLQLLQYRRDPNALIL